MIKVVFYGFLTGTLKGLLSVGGGIVMTPLFLSAGFSL
jgi:uncharacterized membrane protein YfcA